MLYETKHTAPPSLEKQYTCWLMSKGMLKQNPKGMRSINMEKIKTETVSGNIPEKRFSTGALSATVWQNEGKSKEGQDVSYRTVTFQRRYKDPNGEWQTANSLRVNDLPKACLILGKAYEYIVVKDLNAA